MTSIENVFSNKERVLESLSSARKVFGDKRTTQEQYDSMERCLAFAFVYCPDDLRDIVKSTLDESSRRRLFYEFNIWPKQ